MLNAEVQLAEHCNLNCAYCTHFSPLAEPELLDLASFTRDMQRLSELFYGEMRFIKLMGGEPLLHPDVASFVRVVRSAFPVGDILIVTNGLLLPKMPEAFWLACRDCRAIVTPTYYPVDFIDYAAGAALAAQYGVEYVEYDAYCGGSGGEKTMYKQIIDTAGRQDPRNSFIACSEANNCLMLRSGRMYTCPIAATAHHFSKRFGVELHESPMDSIDIYTARSGREILEFLARPIPFCRYCDMRSPARGFPWKRSDKAISEWTR